MVKLLRASGMRVTVLDNLSSGRREAVLGAELVVMDLAERSRLVELFERESFDAVMHFASLIQVGESVTNPNAYYQNNVGCTINLLDAMRITGVDSMIFSSTAAIFGEPDTVPIHDDHRVQPQNPYGHSKAMAEQIITDHVHAYGLRAMCLRYFNAAGADPDGELGERHDPETHLIPIVLDVALGVRPRLSIFGDDYDTPDGTCVRDYIHVVDLCEAHLLALNALREGSRGGRFNLGNGSGYSVREVVKCAERVTGTAIPSAVVPRRPGDPAVLVANSTRAQSELGWKPRHPELESSVASAWAWHARNHPTER
jgi:UDP-glucose 4-epimerase